MLTDEYMKSQIGRGVLILGNMNPSIDEVAYRAIQERDAAWRALLAARESLRLLLTLVPPWAEEAPPGLCATMYGTGTQAGDQEVVERVRRARALLPEHSAPSS